MGKVLIISDSHGLTKEISEIKSRHQIDHLIHCGDSELEKGHPVLEDMINVRGNCDFDNNLQYIEQLDVAGLHFFITHGHLYDVGLNLENLYDHAYGNNAQVVCYGHTHVAGAQKIDDILFVNPGSIRLPRQRKEKSYAIMEWENFDHIHINFYTNNGKKIDDLSYVTSLML